MTVSCQLMTPGCPSGIATYLGGQLVTFGGPQAAGGLEALRLATPLPPGPSIMATVSGSGLSGTAGMFGQQYAGPGPGAAFIPLASGSAMSNGQAQGTNALLSGTQMIALYGNMPLNANLAAPFATNPYAGTAPNFQTSGGVTTINGYTSAQVIASAPALQALVNSGAIVVVSG
jgi:hypothetical protein